MAAATEKKKILFVDDDMAYMFGIVERLEYLGYEVTLKTNPEDAFAWLKENSQVDLFICDLMMYENQNQSLEAARLAGIDLIKRAQSAKVLTCPVVILTGVTHDEVLIEAEQVTPFVVKKSCSQASLTEIIQAALATSRRDF